MARSMIARRHEAERERLATFDASLRRVSAARRPPPDFEKALNEAKRGFESLIVRDAWTWQPHLKTRDAARLRFAAARHLFARFPVARPLEAIWLDQTGLDADEVKLRKRWYIAAARGDSLYKAGADAWLSRKEVHAFLNPLGDVSFTEAFWQAIARGYTDDASTAQRIGRSKVAATPRQELTFWRDVARFFCVNAASAEEIDDLCDYLGAQFTADRAYSVKGRTLVSLHRQMREWHRDLDMRGRIEAARQRALRAAGVKGADPGRWQGSPLQDWSWQPSTKGGRHGQRETFTVVQLVTADDLMAEGRAMRHCVWSYAGQCIAGRASIWSLRRRFAGDQDRLLTIELDRQHRAVQVRGFANRVARPEEKQILGRWAQARGVILLS